MQILVNKILNDAIIADLIRKSEQQYVLRQLYDAVESNVDEVEVLRLVFYLINADAINTNDKSDKDAIASTAYKLLRAMNINTPDAAERFGSVMGIDGIDNATLYYFYLSTLALKADDVISIRLALRQFSPSNVGADWKFLLLENALNACILLIRKENGFEDVRQALLLIERLQQTQTDFEEDYLSQYGQHDKTAEALILLALYHASKAIVETAKYLIYGYDYRERIDAIIRQHIDIAGKLLQHEPRLKSLLGLLEFCLNTLKRNSIWTRTNFNDKLQGLCRNKAELGMLDLLPSQRNAISQNLFDVASNVTVLQMPTSAGKTLLAEFNILVTKSLKPQAKIIYIVPSRALVNQVYHDLKTDLEGLELVIEKTSSAIEINPTENSFLSSDNNIDILVSTPEKLDLLIRRDHPSVADVSMFVVDEAHTVQNGERGARLELLIAILRRERPQAKFMLLSPFINQAGDVLTDWLGGGNSIKVDWRPAEKLIAGINCHVTTRINNVHFDVLASPYSSVQPIENLILPNPFILESTTGKNRILEFATKQFAEERKSMLVLCKGKGTTNKRAEFISKFIDKVRADDEIQLVRKYIDDEVGRETQLSRLLEKGITTHHAGMSDETKLLVEHLIRQRKINFICATSTIAEGVNFPVSTVFFDTYTRGMHNKLTPNDFWNIAGRAGRTMIDNYGKIILPFHDAESKVTANGLLEQGANELVSVLAELFVNADNIEQQLQSQKGLEQLIYNYPNSVAPLVQYFVHLLTVCDNHYYVNEIEDLFKDSLEYFLLDSNEKKQRFIGICKSIYLNIQQKYLSQGGALSYADKTGFSVPSVLKVMSDCAHLPQIKNLESWKKEQLFNTSNPDNLADKIRVIAALKETKLGTESDFAPFNAEIMAQIIISWVKGAKLSSIAQIHPFYQRINDSEEQVNEFVSKMNSVRFKASWGLSALEGIVRGNQDAISDSYIPSLVYYGVDNEKALAFRMIGVPRALSASLTQIIDKDISQYSFQKLRKMLYGLTNTDWDHVTPQNSELSGVEWRRIVEILMK